MSTKVTLRQKPISGNRKSLYLDFYPAILHPGTGEPTRRKFLKMFIYSPIKIVERKTKKGLKIIPVYDLDPEKNNNYTIHNESAIRKAEKIRAERQNELEKPEIYSGFEREQLRVNGLKEKSFIEYFTKLANKRKSSNFDNWISTLNHLKNFTGRDTKFGEVTETFCNEFKEFLVSTPSIKSSKTTLAQNSVFSYYNKFKSALKQAYKDGYLQTDINSKIDRVKPAETRRNFLTIEDLNQLIKAECSLPVLKQAALFSALTGLRFADIKKLEWKEIEFIKGNGYFINFTQQKTKGIEMMPISEQAFALMGQPGEPNNKIFTGLKYSSWVNTQLFKWLVKAGITKDITFHNFRHTYATLQLSKGTDIYTVSKMLGHRELKTTQIYAKIIDQTKRDTTNKIQLDF